jgi:MFS family permease
LVLLIAASGLFNTFVSVRLEIEGYDPEAIGFVASALYGGILIGSLWIDRWIARVGHIRSFIIFAILSAILVLGQGAWINPWYWSSLRLIGGVCMAGIFISIESWMLIQSSPKTRGAVLSLYLGVFYGALTLGQFLFNLVGVNGFLPFCITAILCILSVIPLIITKISEPKIERMTHLSLGQLFRLSPLGFFGGIISGMILAGVYGLVPVYAKEIGLSIPQIGNLMAAIIFGGLSLQWPLGRWADSGKRRHILCLVSFLSAFFGLSIAVINHDSLIFLLLLAWCFGGFSFTLYPLSMAYTCEKLQDHQMIAATGGFVLSYGIGAIAGPLLAPLAMDLLGTPGLFYFLSGISFLLGLFGLIQTEENPVAPEE